MKRTVLTILAVSVVANIAWVAFVLNNLRTTQVKTTATVTQIQTCQFSNRNECPIFMWRDATGKQYQMLSTEGFDGLNEPIFGVKVGDTRAAWYSKSDPSKVYILYGAGMLSVWALPIIAGGLACVGFVFIKHTKKDKIPAALFKK